MSCVKIETIEVKKRPKIGNFFRTIVALVFVVLAIAPLYLLLVNATRSASDIIDGIKLIPGAEFLNNFKKVMEGTGSASTITFKTALRNSIIVTVPTTFLQVYFGAMTAYGLTVYDFKHKNAVWIFIYAIMMVPTQITLVGLIKVCNLTHLYGTFWPLILPAIATPTTVYFMKQYMDSALSMGMIESARIDGAGEFRTFNRIVFPTLKPAIATQAILAFVASWNNLYTPSILLATEPSTKGTIPMYIEALKANDKGRDYGQIYCGLLITLIPILIVYLTLSERIIEGVVVGSEKE